MDEGTRHEAFPLKLELPLPERYERWQVLVRCLVGMALGLLHQSALGIAGALYLVLPMLAAILLTRATHASAPGFAEQDRARLEDVVEWLLGFYAYMLMASDRFPLEREGRVLRITVTQHGRPVLATVLTRLLSSLPFLCLGFVLAIAAGCVSVVMAICVLIDERAPQRLAEFQRNIIAWLGRFFVYHASLVDVYPPWSLVANDAADSQI